jgi:hypothetical protein
LNDLDFFDTLETDFFDIFFFYGVLGLSLYIVFFILSLIRAINNRNYFNGFIFFLVFVYSAVAGHVLFNSMSVVSLVLLYFFSTRKSDFNCVVASSVAKG